MQKREQAKSALHAAASRKVLHVARGLAASAGACTTKFLTPSLFKNEKDFPATLTIWMGLFRALTLGRFSLLLHTQTSEVTVLWRHCLTDTSPFQLQCFASYLPSCVRTDDNNGLKKRRYLCVFVQFINNTTETKAPPCFIEESSRDLLVRYDFGNQNSKFRGCFQ